MKTKTYLTTIALASALALGTAVFASAQEPAQPQQTQGAAGVGQGWNCPMGQSMGSGMMGQGMGPGAMQPLARDLEPSDVERMMNSWLAWQGNPNLRLGRIEARDDYVIISEIVTTDGSLIQRYEVNRQTGWMRPAQ